MQTLSNSIKNRTLITVLLITLYASHSLAQQNDEQCEDGWVFVNCCQDKKVKKTIGNSQAETTYTVKKYAPKPENKQKCDERIIKNSGNTDKSACIEALKDYDTSYNRFHSLCDNSKILNQRGKKTCTKTLHECFKRKRGGGVRTKNKACKAANIGDFDQVKEELDQAESEVNAITDTIQSLNEQLQQSNNDLKGALREVDLQVEAKNREIEITIPDLREDQRIEVDQRVRAQFNDYLTEMDKMDSDSLKLSQELTKVLNDFNRAKRRIKINCETTSIEKMRAFFSVEDAQKRNGQLSVNSLGVLYATRNMIAGKNNACKSQYQSSNKKSKSCSKKYRRYEKEYNECLKRRSTIDEELAIEESRKLAIQNINDRLADLDRRRLDVERRYNNFVQDAQLNLNRAEKRLLNQEFLARRDISILEQQKNLLQNQSIQSQQSLAQRISEQQNRQHQANVALGAAISAVRAHQEFGPTGVNNKDFETLNEIFSSYGEALGSRNNIFSACCVESSNSSELIRITGVPGLNTIIKSDKDCNNSEGRYESKGGLQ